MSALDRFLEIGDVTHTVAPAMNQLWRDAKAELVALRTEGDRYLEELVDRRAEVAAMSAEIEDWRNASHTAALESCGDEVHCACVGPLRARVAAMEKAVEAADALAVADPWVNLTDRINAYRAAREASR